MLIPCINLEETKQGKIPSCHPPQPVELSLFLISFSAEILKLWWLVMWIVLE